MAATYNKEEVNVVETQALQALLKAKLNSLVAGGVGGPQLGDNVDVLTFDAIGKSLLEALANLVLVGVAVGTIDSLVADLKRV